MNEKGPEIFVASAPVEKSNEGKDNEKYPDYDLVAEKILASLGATKDEMNYQNKERAGEILYKAIFNPDSFREIDIKNPESYDRGKILKKSINSAIITIPSPEEFQKSFVRATIHEADFEKALFEIHTVVEQFISELARHGNIIIWSAGGHGESFNEVTQKTHHGHYEQAYRIAKIGLGSMRRKLAKSDPNGRTAEEILSIVTREDKFEKFEDDIIERLRKNKSDCVVVLEDNGCYLQRFAELVNEADLNIKIFPIIIKQGRWEKLLPEKNNMTTDDWEKEFNAVNSIREVVDILKKNGIIDNNKTGNKKISFVLDLDDTLLDTQARLNQQVIAVINMMTEKKWLNI